MSPTSRCRAKRLPVGLLVAAFLVACGGASNHVPEELIEIWTTDTAAYKDRYFELRPKTLIFGTGDDMLKMHRIEHVEATPTAPGSIEYAVDYLVEDGETAQIKFVHTAGPPATIRMANHSEIWKPQKKSLGENLDG
jgi:hypothetical protein